MINPAVPSRSHDWATSSTGGGSADCSRDTVAAELFDQFVCTHGIHASPEKIEVFVAEHPQHAEQLRDCFAGLRILGTTRRVKGESTSRAPTRSLPESGQTVGDFVIEREIGRGAMGVVYAAKQISLARTVAIKILLPSLRVSDSRKERFHRESLAAASLDHPHIASVFAVGQNDGYHYFAMQLIEGQSLRDPPACMGTDWRTLARRFAEVADALETAHVGGVIHRDIKPTNLLIEPNGKIWVTDFGLARIGQPSELTASGDLVGTLRYMSPEQASGRADRIDGRTDIYSLGATLYELVCGRAVFSDLEGIELLEAIRSSEPIPPRRIDATIDPDLATIIRRAMRPDKNDRYQSAASMAEDLRLYADGQPIHARRVSLGERSLAWTRQHASSVLTILVIAFVLLGAAMMHNRLLSREQSRTQQQYLEARGAVDRLGAKYADRLANVDGAEEIRRDLLAETLGYYERFIASSRDDPRLQRDVALTRLEVARQISRLGNGKQADQAYAEAMGELRAVDGLEATLTRAINERAMLRSEHGDHAGALKLLNTVDADGQSSAESAQRIAALTWNHLAIVHHRMNRPDLALPMMRRAISAISDLDSVSTDDQIDEDLAGGLNNLAAMLSDAGNFDQAAELARSCVRLRSLNEGSESSRQTAIALSNVGTIFLRGDRFDEAIETLEEARRGLTVIARRNSRHSSARCDLAVTLNNLAMAHAALNRTSEAKAVFAEAEEWLRPVLEEDPSHRAATRAVAGIRNNLDVLRRGRGPAPNAAYIRTNQAGNKSAATR